MRGEEVTADVLDGWRDSSYSSGGNWLAHVGGDRHYVEEDVLFRYVGRGAGGVFLSVVVEHACVCSEGQLVGNGNVGTAAASSFGQPKDVLTIRISPRERNLFGGWAERALEADDVWVAEALWAAWEACECFP